MASNTIDKVESAANISLTISKGGSGTPENGNTSDSGKTNEEVQAGMMSIPISRLDRTKDIEISEIRQSSLKANGYSVTSISFSGSMMFKGEKVRDPNGGKPKRIQDLLFDKEGVPVPVSITITHDISDNSETYQNVLVTSESYEVQSESETETAFDWIAMDKK